MCKAWPVIVKKKSVTGEPKTYFMLPQARMVPYRSVALCRSTNAITSASVIQHRNAHDTNKNHLTPGAEGRIDARTVNLDENEKVNLAWGFRQSCVRYGMARHSGYNSPREPVLTRRGGMNRREQVVATRQTNQQFKEVVMAVG
ncbi:hypothetical protein CBL_14520 [Carabus blaptoides fortunei]